MQRRCLCVGADVDLHDFDCALYNAPQSESEKFFAAVNDGRVELEEVISFREHRLMPLDPPEVGGIPIRSFRVVITPKEVGE